MATMFKRGNQWWVSYLVGERRYRKSLNTQSKEIAKRKLRAIEEQLATRDGLLPHTPRIQVSALTERYLAYAREYYRKDGKPTSQQHIIGKCVERLNVFAGNRYVNEFGPAMLKAFRDTLVQEDLARTTINAYVGQVKRIFQYGVEEELVPGEVYMNLRAVKGLGKGRFKDVREAPRRTPVPEQHIDAVRNHGHSDGGPLARPLRALIDLQLCTGARPGEVCILTPDMINRDGDVWIVDFGDVHKTAHHGKTRILCIGPNGQEILKPFLREKGPGAPLFSPRDTLAEYLERRGDELPQRNPDNVGIGYTFDFYRRAIARACERLEIPLWSPNRLRHNAATMIRAQFGIEKAPVGGFG